MNQKQLKTLPAVSEVLLEVNRLTDVDQRILTLWINEVLEKYRYIAKKGKLKQNRKKNLPSERFKPLCVFLPVCS